VIVRWGLDGLAPLLEELGLDRPLLVTSARFAELDVPVANRFAGVRRHAPVEVVAAATDAASRSDGLVAVGGGSAIDTSKAVSAATGLPVVAVPTTYSGSEWTPYFGMRDEARRAKTGGSGANTVAVVYEPTLTFDLPREETVGTAMNALAHCAEALYAGPCQDASIGAELIALWLPAVVADGRDLEARTKLLEGAMHAGTALAERGLFLAHAMAQALGGRYGASHGALNALCLAPALRFNEPVVPDAVAALARAIEVTDAPARIEELARLGGFERLRDVGIPEDELSAAATETAERPAARSNPRPATPADIEALFRSIW
jgi:alcohol dehydrogenase class IV